MAAATLPLPSITPSVTAVQTAASLGAFRPTQLLSDGPDGMAMVALQQPRNEPCELRYFRTSTADPERRTQLLERLQRISLVGHPSVRSLFEYAEHNEVIVVALEAPGGESLLERLEAGPLLPRHAMRLCHHLAHALASAHRIGLVHGTLCPSEIWIDKHGVPRIELTGMRVRGPSRFVLDQSCIAPEQRALPSATASHSDVFALGKILQAMLSGAPTHEHTAGPLRTARLVALLEQSLANDPEERPSMEEWRAQLQAALEELSASTREQDATEQRAWALPTPTETFHGAREGVSLGRFYLQKKLGAGGMGEVYEALDLGTGDTVAVKILRREHSDDPVFLKRFKKEARVLAQVRSSYIANLIELNEDHGLHFIVQEFVHGRSLQTVLEERGRFEERDALELIADACRALLEPHRQGIIHRDLKPDNMLFVNSLTEKRTNEQPTPQRLKVCDFGIARSNERATTVQVTREGMTIGTPEYMAPEQARALPVGPPTDVYALGVTLFALLTGRLPFEGATAIELALKHVHEAPPPLETQCPNSSERVCALVDKALAKDPTDRFPDASAMLEAVQAILYGAPPTDATVHPRLPAHDPSKIKTWQFEWQLRSSPEQLWPLIAHTDRVNRATGLTPVTYETKAGAPGFSQRFGAQRMAGIPLRWREHPYEWIAHRRYSILREFESGALYWYIAEVELFPRPEGGTLLRYTVRLQPRWFLAKLLAPFEVGIKLRRSLDKLYRRIDEQLSRTPQLPPETDPFSEEVSLPARTLARIDEAMDRLRLQGIGTEVTERLGAFLAHASEQDVARIRPLEFARRTGLDEDQVLDCFLHAAQQGTLQLLWDVLCPSCGIPTSFADSLRKIEEHAQCTACNLRFPMDFSRSIELIFRAAPALRKVETRTYCIGGPGHFPHVMAQTRLAPGEQLHLPMKLAAGSYVVRTPQLPGRLEVRVAPEGRTHRADVHFSQHNSSDGPRVRLAEGSQLFVLHNTLDQEILVRIDRSSDREEVLTAARVSAKQTFRELFPEQQLAPGLLLGVQHSCLLVTEFDTPPHFEQTLGTAKYYGLVVRKLQLLTQLVRENGGALVKTTERGMLACFDASVDAVRAALAMRATLAKELALDGFRLRVGVHAGPTLTTTLNGTLDYFGAPVLFAMQLPSHCESNGVLLSRIVAQESEVQELLGVWQLRGEPKTLPEQERHEWCLQLEAPRTIPEQ